jgi:transketolase N-terminal domain/subunit
VILAWLSEVCYEAQHRLGAYGKQMSIVTWAIADFCWQLDQIKHWKLAEDVAKLLYNRGHTFLAMYQALAHAAIASKKRLYGFSNINTLCWRRHEQGTA